jgi:TonB family protein
MKYALRSFVILIVLLIGCTVPRQVESVSEQPELLSMAPLPPLTSTLYTDGTKFNVLLHVLQDGSVEYVRMLGSSGDSEWDAEALESIKQWRFATPYREGQPVDLWFRQLIIVQIQEPVFMTIGQVTCSSQQEADSLYAFIRANGNADDLFDHAIANVNIMQFPQRVRREIQNLSEGEFSAPMRLGDKYIIYKRFPAKGKESPAL